MAKYNSINNMAYSNRLGNWVNPNDYTYMDYIPQQAYRYAGYDNKTPFTETMRNKFLSTKSKLSNSQVPAVYDSNFADAQKSLYGNLAGDAAMDATFDKMLGNAPVSPKSGGLKGLFTNNFGWSKGKGLKMFGKNLGGWTGAGTIVPGIMAGAQAIGNINALEDANKSTEDLLGDIMASANSNPIVNSYLSTDQRSLLRDIKNGKFDPEEIGLDTFIPDDFGSLLDIGKGALTGIAGGVPGMIVGGIGGAVNSGLEDAISKAGSSQAELESLLFALQDAEAQYQAMKRPNFTGLGIQQRYQDMYA